MTMGETACSPVALNGEIDDSDRILDFLSEATGLVREGVDGLAIVFGESQSGRHARGREARKRETRGGAEGEQLVFASRSVETGGECRRGRKLRSRLNAEATEPKRARNFDETKLERNDRDSLLFSFPAMETLAARPSAATLLAQWDSFYSNPLLSSAQLASDAIAGRISQRGLRSLHWRVSISSLFHCIGTQLISAIF